MCGGESPAESAAEVEAPEPVVTRSATSREPATPPTTEDARARLETMVRTANGFEIAETDLQLRGPGEFFGTRQSGEMGFHVANPLRDREFLETARKEAFALAEDSQRSQELRQTLRALPAQWQRRYHLAQIG